MNNSTYNWAKREDENLDCEESTGLFASVHVVFFALTFISSVVGNSLVIGSILKFKQLRTGNSNFLIGILAFSNLLIAGLLPLEFIRTIYPETSRKLICCLVYFSMIVLLMSCAGGTFLIISLERFLAVIFPLRHRMHLTRRRLKILLVFIWSFSIIFASLPSLLSWNKLTYLPIGTKLAHCTFHTVAPPVFQTLFMCYAIFHLLANVALLIPVIYMSRKVTSGREKSHSGVNRGLTKRMAYSFATFSISWCPFWSSSIAAVLYQGPLVICIQTWSIHIGLLHSAVDWLIYGLANKTFRKAFKQLLLCRKSIVDYSDS